MTSAPELADKIEAEGVDYPGMRYHNDGRVQIYDGGNTNLFISEAGGVTEWDVEGDLGGRSVDKHFKNSREVIHWLKEQFN